MRLLVYVAFIVKLYSAAALYAIDVDETYQRSLILQDLANQTVLIDCSDTRDGTILLRRQGSKCPEKDFFVSFQVKYNRTCTGALRFYLNIRSIQFKNDQKVHLLGSQFDGQLGQTLSGVAQPSDSSPLSVAQFFTSRDSLRIEYSDKGNCDSDLSQLVADFSVVRSGKEIRCPALQGTLPLEVMCGAAKQMRIVCPEHYRYSKLADNPASPYSTSKLCSDTSETTSQQITTNKPKMTSQTTGESTPDASSYIPKLENAMYPFPNAWAPGSLANFSSYYPWQSTTLPPPKNNTNTQSDGNNDFSGKFSVAKDRKTSTSSDSTDRSDTPDIPDKSDIPDVTDDPDTEQDAVRVSSHVTTEESDQPDKPDIPDTPDTPDTPDIPDKPDTPNQLEGVTVSGHVTTDESDLSDKPDKPDTPNKLDILEKYDAAAVSGHTETFAVKMNLTRHKTAEHPYPYPLGLFEPTDGESFHPWEWSTIFPQYDKHRYNFSRWTILAGAVGLGVVSVILVYAFCRLCCRSRNTVHCETTTVITRGECNPAYGTFHPAQNYVPNHHGIYANIYTQPLLKPYGSPAPPYAPMEVKAT